MTLLCHIHGSLYVYVNYIPFLYSTSALQISLFSFRLLVHLSVWESANEREMSSNHKFKYLNSSAGRLIAQLSLCVFHCFFQFLIKVHFHYYHYSHDYICYSCHCYYPELFIQWFLQLCLLNTQYVFSDVAHGKTISHFFSPISKNFWWHCCSVSWLLSFPKERKWDYGFTMLLYVCVCPHFNFVTRCIIFTKFSKDIMQLETAPASNLLIWHTQ
jgi:hypothetical protein